jgi:hypothetical protein
LRGWRFVPSPSFFDAIEGKQHKALRRGSIQTNYILRADDVATAGFGKLGRRRFVYDASLESCWVLYAADGHNNVCRWFGLGVKDLNSGSTKRNSAEQSQSHFVCDCHSDLPICFANPGTHN